MTAAPSHAEKPHILIVDDDDRIRDLVTRYLTREGFITAAAADAAEARILLKQFTFEALVLDVMMPGESGLDLTRSLKEEGFDPPVLLLTALGDVDHRLEGFERGADDYLPKPFEPKELIFRLRSLIKRRMELIDKKEKIVIGEWYYLPDHARLDPLSGDGDSAPLTEVEQKLLEALLAKRGDALSREELAALCGMTGSERAIDVQVTRLRKKLEPDPASPRYLRTIRGKGYMVSRT